MALGSSVFHPDFGAHLAPVAIGGMLARIQIERPGTTGKWNAATGEYEGGDSRVLYLGKARVQKVAKPTRREFVFDSADNQMVRVQLHLSQNEADPGEFHWQSNDEVRLLVVGADTMMQGQKVYIHGWPGSSNAIVTTLHCGFNAKQDGDA